MRLCNLLGTGFLKLLFFCGFSFTLLSLNFYTNFLHSAEQNWFATFDRASERAVIGRLIKSRQDGIFSSGGLSVSGVSSEAALKDPLCFFNDKFDNYAAYTENARVEHFIKPYYSQICGQGIFYSILDKIIAVSPAVKLRIFHGVSSCLTALILMVVIGWFYVEFGLFVGLTVLVFALLSQWLTVFARSLWWSTWAFYLPMAIVMLYFQCMPKYRHTQYFKLGSIVFFSILIKTIFNGYEYITTTLVMMIVPFVYYSILDKVGLTAFFNRLVRIAMSACLAIAVSLCILFFQIASVSGSFMDGFNHITYTLMKRTHATPNEQMDSLLVETLQAPTLSVVRSYLDGGFCSIDTGLFNDDASAAHFRYDVSYATLILFFAAMTLVLLLSAKRCAAKPKDRRLYALIVASWLSILAPLSWFVVFKSHSYAHQHLNMIVWQMPFTFFGAAITGQAVRHGFSRLFLGGRSTNTSSWLCR